MRGRAGAARGGRQQRLRVATAVPYQVLEHQAHSADHQGHREGDQVDRQHGGGGDPQDRAHQRDDGGRDGRRPLEPDGRRAGALAGAVAERGHPEGGHRDPGDRPPRLPRRRLTRSRSPVNPATHATAPAKESARCRHRPHLSPSRPPPRPLRVRPQGRGPSWSGRTWSCASRRPTAAPGRRGRNWAGWTSSSTPRN
ncbi:hypothetical protein SBRY_30702 [Actinacidiphila bryophytorum]|uniref:Uncharacterized protein n=1 Tax=Actinacidiphila bryophytorum TaxID=1436133 RepID=A0A9W4H1N1_9ACTN|nr:hypothetical protein SBRY_30702 [Actinacidiphila bryophytorum]